MELLDDLDSAWSRAAATSSGKSPTPYSSPEGAVGAVRCEHGHDRVHVVLRHAGRVTREQLLDLDDVGYA
jgi:hypothetical protein